MIVPTARTVGVHQVPLRCLVSLMLWRCLTRSLARSLRLLLRLLRLPASAGAASAQSAQAAAPVMACRLFMLSTIPRR